MRDIDSEIRSKEFLRSRSRKALSYCEDCGAKVYGTDEDGEPYRLCYKCSRGL